MTLAALSVARGAYKAEETVLTGCPQMCLVQVPVLLEQFDPTRLASASHDRDLFGHQPNRRRAPIPALFGCLTGGQKFLSPEPATGGRSFRGGVHLKGSTVRTNTYRQLLQCVAGADWDGNVVVPVVPNSVGTTPCVDHLCWVGSCTNRLGSRFGESVFLFFSGEGIEVLTGGGEHP